jgi:hypothetical protein
VSTARVQLRKRISARSAEKQVNWPRSPTVEHTKEARTAPTTSTHIHSHTHTHVRFGDNVHNADTSPTTPLPARLWVSKRSLVRVCARVPFNLCSNTSAGG